MSLQSLRLVIASRPRLQLRILPRFPKGIVGVGGIEVRDEGGNKVVAPDYESVAAETEIAALSVSWSLVWNRTADEYRRVLWSDIVAQIVGLVEGGETITDIEAAIVALQDGKQPLDADLTSLADIGATGLAARTAAGSWTVRTITGTANQITVTYGDGVSGDPVLALHGDVMASLALADTAVQPDDAASETAAGIVELATVAEAEAGTDTERAVTPAGLAAGIAALGGSGIVPRGYIHKLTLANNATDATNDIDVAPGQAASEDDDPVLMTLAAAMTKRLDATYTAGDGNGGRFDASISDAWWNVFLIQSADGLTVDVGFSTSLDPTGAANFPAGYSYRRIGAVLRTSSAIRGFYQSGDVFTWNLPGLDHDSASSTTAALITLAVPAGVEVAANLSCQVVRISSQGTVWISSPSQTDATPGVGSPYTMIPSEDVGGVYGLTGLTLMTNTSRQVRVRASLTGVTVRIQTNGYRDTRGRL